MKCPKCGFVIGENDTICRGCGESVFRLKQLLQEEKTPENFSNSIQQEKIEILDNTVSNQYQNMDVHNETKIPINNMENTKNIDNSKTVINNDVPEVSGKYLRAYIGPNYETLVMPRSFSFCSFFLGAWYWAYRRDLSLAIVYCIVINFLLFLFGDLIIFALYFIFNIYFSSIYKTLYVENAKKKVNEIVNNHKESEEDLLKELASKGNPSWLNVLIIAIIGALIGKIF